MSVKVHEAVCFDSLQDRLFFFDDFHGDQIQDEWAEAGAGSVAVIDAQTGGIVRITTGATLNNTYRIDWGDIRSLLVSKKATMELRVKLNQSTYISPDLRLSFDGTNYIAFYANEGAGGAENWDIWCRDGGVGAAQDSGIAIDTDYHIFRIECHTHGSSHVHFYIDDTETASSPITTNIPDDATDYLQPRLSLRTRENATKSMDVDYVYIRQER